MLSNQKRNKRLKRLRYSNLGTIKNYRRALKRKADKYKNLDKEGKLRKPEWYNSIHKLIHDAYRNRPDVFFRTKTRAALAQKKPEAVLYKKKTRLNSLSFKLNPPMRFKKVFKEATRKKQFMQHIIRLKKRFIGPRTQKQWWLDHTVLRTYDFWRKIRKGFMSPPEKFKWQPKTRNKIRTWLYLSRKTFKSVYDIKQTKKLKKLFIKTYNSKKYNKLNEVFKNLESQLKIVLIRMGFVNNIKVANTLIKSGLVKVNGITSTLPEYRLKPNDIVTLTYVNFKIPYRLKHKFNHLERWSTFFKRKQHKHLHVNFRSMSGIFLEYPKLNQQVYHRFFKKTLNKDLLNYLFSQQKTA